MDGWAMDGSATKPRQLGNKALDSSTMSRWTARDGRLGDGAMDGLLMSMYGSAIKRWTACI
jgi:hypothetical protein